MKAVRLLLILVAAAALGTGALGLRPASADSPVKEGKKMYGLIGKITAAEGKRDELIEILLQATKQMPGCLSYVVAKDPADNTSLWVTEVWQDEASHKASLSLPAVRAAMRKGRPLIAKFDQRVVTEPVGGYGLMPGK